jgi:hypothetical protein
MQCPRISGVMLEVSSPKGARLERYRYEVGVR